MEELLALASTPCSDDLYNSIIKSHLSDRRIILNQAIDDSVLEFVSMLILKWNSDDKDLPVNKRKRILIYLNSDGGDVVAGSNVLDIIKNSKTPIATVGFSKCESMAGYILAAGHERYCFPFTVVLYHDGQAGYVSSGNKGKDIQKFYDQLYTNLEKFIVDNTLMTQEFIDDIRDREYYIFGQKAKELGFVDKIVGVDCDIDAIL